MSLRISPIYLYREAMHVLCLCATWVGVVMSTYMTTFNQFAQNSTVGSMLSMYYACSYTAGPDEVIVYLLKPAI